MAAPKGKTKGHKSAKTQKPRRGRRRGRGLGLYPVRTRAVVVAVG